MKQIKGIFVPTVTPFNQDGSLDEDGTLRVINYFNENPSIDGLFIMGATGEYVAMSTDERKKIIDIVTSVAPQKEIIVNVGTTQEESTYELAEYARTKKIKTIGVVIPFFDDSKKVMNYFNNINNFGVDTFIYQPGNSKYQLSVEELIEISSHDNIIGIKDSCCISNMLRHLMYLNALRNKLSIIVGAEGIYLSSLSMGASGVIGGGCNIDPFVLKKVQQCFECNDINQAAKYQRLAFKYIEEFSTEDTCNQSIKYYLNLRGVQCGIHSRTETTRLSPNHKEKIDLLTSELVDLNNQLV